MKLVLDIKIAESPPTAAGKTVTIQILRQEVTVEVMVVEHSVRGERQVFGRLATTGQPDVEEITLGPF